MKIATKESGIGLNRVCFLVLKRRSQERTSQDIPLSKVKNLSSENTFYFERVKCKWFKEVRELTSPATYTGLEKLKGQRCL